MNATIEEAKQRAEVSSSMFADRLQHFVHRWKPEHQQDLYDFQMELTRLMVDAMRHKSDTMGLGITYYAESVYVELAMKPLNVIFQEKKP